MNGLFTVNKTASNCGGKHAKSEEKTLSPERFVPSPSLFFVPYLLPRRQILFVLWNEPLRYFRLALNSVHSRGWPLVQLLSPPNCWDYRYETPSQLEHLQAGLEGLILLLFFNWVRLQSDESYHGTSVSIAPLPSLHTPSPLPVSLSPSSPSPSSALLSFVQTAFFMLDLSLSFKTKVSCLWYPAPCLGFQCRLWVQPQSLILDRQWPNGLALAKRLRWGHLKASVKFQSHWTYSKIRISPVWQAGDPRSRGELTAGRNCTAHLRPADGSSKATYLAAG